MQQSDHEYEERSFGDIQRAIDFENSMNDLESQLYYRRLSPKEVAQQVLKATCQFYDADWCGLIQVDLDLNLWTPFWWFNTGATDKTMQAAHRQESSTYWSAGYIVWDCGRQAERPGAAPKKRQ